ncbi:acylneuraminate cytidylyltransferase family protein [Nonlabens sp.]|jgi:N-acylneuraminate cytidylyltransferase|uniref:acylneuraminate cytidylyltransferase family protein n=1 Tax=Nonlabens sp. TaxID=1888209 RepID=UPI003F6A02B2
MRVLGIIPARGGSKGVPEKNKKLLCGKPLINYTIESALNSSLLTQVIVSTEDQEIVEIAKKSGADVPFLRPEELASDTAKSIDVVVHAINYMKSIDESFDAICLLQPTVPFREKGSIDTAIESFIKNQNDSLISVLEVPHQFNPHWVFEEVDGKLKISTGENEIVSRRQELPPAFYRDGSIYVTSCKLLLDKNSFFGKSLGYFKSSSRNHLNIDTQEDWKLAEQLGYQLTYGK